MTLNLRQIDWGELLFNASGRIGRGVFLAAIASVIAVLAVYDQALGGLGHLLLGWIIHPLLFFISACLVSKRFHDIGKSGWRSALVLLAFCLAWPYPHGFVGVLSILVLTWVSIELGVTPGAAAFNRFGSRRSRVKP